MRNSGQWYLSKGIHCLCNSRLHMHAQGQELAQVKIHLKECIRPFESKRFRLMRVLSCNKESTNTRQRKNKYYNQATHTAAKRKMLRTRALTQCFFVIKAAKIERERERKMERDRKHSY